MIKQIAFISVLCLGVFGCVEHFISVHIQPNGSYSIEFISRGDSTDMFDDDFPHPTAGEKWAQHVWSNRTKDDTTWIMETRGFIDSQSPFLSSGGGAGALIHPFNVEIKKRWISTLYVAKHTFNGREIYRKYPRLGETLEASANTDSIEWITEALVYIVSSALKDLENKTDVELTPFLIERMTNHVRNYAERVKSKKLVTELGENRNDFLVKLLNPFADLLVDEFYTELEKAMHPYEEELRITTGLQDDKFHFLLTMPGLITRSNADSLVNDTLKWTFELGDFAGDDYVMEAVSVVYKTKTIQKIAIIVIFAGLGLWLFLWIMVFRKP